MTQKNWRALVARGKEIASAEQSIEAGRSEVRFDLGDCALEAEPLAASRGAKNGGYERLAEYAGEIDVEFNTLRVYRAVAAAWPKDTRVSSVAWAVHRALMGYDDRAELITDCEWTPEALRALKTERRRPKVGVVRNDKWWEAEKEALRHLRGWKKDRVAGLRPAEAKRRAELLREAIAIQERIADALETYSYTTRL